MKRSLHDTHQQALADLVAARGAYINARGRERVEAETALRLASATELAALVDLLDEITSLN